jgi:hypothetical protein
MQVIEKHVGGAMAEPETILRLVEREDMFNAEHPNYGLLRNRLDGMASKHNGKVHIHGRLFAQWLHHAFPRVCPYPHEAGTTNPMTPDDWMAETGHENIKASDDEVEHHMNKQSTDSTAFPDELPWSDEEELFVIRTPQPPKASTVWEKGASLLEVAGVVVLVVLLAATPQAVLAVGPVAHPPEARAAGVQVDDHLPCSDQLFVDTLAADDAAVAGRVHAVEAG